MVQEVCKVAGYEVAAPFPCITYAQAIENYGIDKPDMRIPPMHPVHDLLPELANAGLPLVAIHIPACGTPSRKERDEFKAFGQERGLRVYDDAKRLERDYPEQMAKVRERCGAKEDSLLVLAAWAGEPKGHRPAETVSGLRAVAPHCETSSTTAINCWTRKISSSCGSSISDVRVEREDIAG
jgi:aspartyl-tRNA synthetase